MPNNRKPQCPLENLKQRAFLFSEIRRFFVHKGVMEVETPVLSSSGNTDINIESFSSEQINTDFSCSYLRTSPEFPLKRLLCSGSGDIYELGKVFRKGEVSKTHNVEFTMLEWYRMGFDYQQLYREVIELFQYLMKMMNLPIADYNVLTYSDCFAKYLNIDLMRVAVADLNKKCIESGYSGSELTRDEALDFLFAVCIQPVLEKDILTVVTLYPASQAALSQINPMDISTSLRFEIYYQGSELANGYQELTDAEEQRYRFENDNKIRKINNQNPINIDRNLLQAMENGMPECSGVAVGVDRLLMVFTGVSDIRNVISFTSENA